MLVLGCRKGQTITVGGTIKFKILGIRGKKVTVGVEAPNHMPIRRGEELERRQTDEDRKEL